MIARIDSFSGEAADLPHNKRTADHVLDVLRKHPRVSCFDLGEKAWLRAAIVELVRRGAIKHDDSDPYPWVRYTVTPNAGAKAQPAEASD